MAKRKQTQTALLDEVDSVGITDAKTETVIEPPIEAEIVEPKPGLPAINLGVTDATIDHMKEQYAALDCSNAANYEMTRQAISTCRGLRVQAEKTKKKLNENALAWQRTVNAEYKRIEGRLLEIETPLQEKKDAVDNEKERLRQEKEEKERLELEAKIKAERDALEAQEKAEREAEAARVKAEQDARAEELRKAEEELTAKLKAMRDEKAKQDELDRIERERIAKEQADKQAITDAENKRIADEQRIEREKLDAQREALRVEQERLERIETEKRVKEQIAKDVAAAIEREKAEAAERERLAAEEKKRIEAERPDVEKINQFAAIFRALVIPVVKAKRAKEFVQSLRNDIEEIATQCEAFK
jgi:hypothetical protein